MAEWGRKDAEMAIALKRAELNRALSYKVNYDAEGHNICLALIRFKDNTIDVLTAYSNDSAIPESIRLGLNLIPNLYAFMPKTEFFGCDGMAQFHTEPKLLNYLFATPGIRQNAFSGNLPINTFYKSVLESQRERAIWHSQHVKRPDDLASVTLVTEINCCSTCTEYSINRFRNRFPNIPLLVIELGKEVGKKLPVQFEKISISITPK